LVVNDFGIEVSGVASRYYEEFWTASPSACRGIGDEAILALPISRRASGWSLNSDAKHGNEALASRESLNGEFPGSRCDRIFWNAAVWSEDVRRPARRGNGSPDSCWPTGQRSHELAAQGRDRGASITVVPNMESERTFLLGLHSGYLGGRADILSRSPQSPKSRHSHSARSILVT
jgi:hypothetical protein